MGRPTRKETKRKRSEVMLCLSLPIYWKPNVEAIIEKTGFSRGYVKKVYGDAWANGAFEMKYKKFKEQKVY